MDINQLCQRLERIDYELADKQIPVLDRPLAALDIINPIGDPRLIFSLGAGEFIDTKMLNVITDWYRNLYGVKTDQSHFEIGQNPVLIRGEVYYIKHYLSYGMNPLEVAQILSRVEDLSKPLAESLNKSELQAIVDEFILGHDAFTKVLSLEDDPNTSLSKLSENLLNRGIANVHSSVAVLKYTRDAQSVAFPVQQAVEMFLKASLARLEPHLTEGEFKNKFGHQSDKVLRELIEKNISYQDIKPLVDRVNVCMKIRYEPMIYTSEDALNSISCMLKIFNFISYQWFI